MDTKSYGDFLEEILYAQGMGISVSVDGKAYTLADVDGLRQVMEDHEYMKSYVSDGKGRIVHIDFDQITGV